MVGNRDCMARVEMLAMPPHPTHRRRWIDGKGPHAILTLLADLGKGAPGTLGVGAGRPFTPTTTKPPDIGPPSLGGRGSLATCGDFDPNPGPTAAVQSVAPQHVLPLDTGLMAPGIRGHFNLRLDPPGRTLWWCTLCGMSWRAAQVSPTCPDGCALADGPPRKGHQGWLRHRQLVIGKWSPEYQAMRSDGLVGAGAATSRI